MDNLIKDNAALELVCWLAPGAELPGWDILKSGFFGSMQATPANDKSDPGEQLRCVQNYFAEYHLEYLRQRRYEHFPSRLHAQLLFATCIDAEHFGRRHPQRVGGKSLIRLQARGAYTCSFHDAAWLDYLCLPHSLSLSELDEVAEHYWSGKTVEEIGPTFMATPWREAPIIEAVYQGQLEAIPAHLGYAHATPFSGFR